MDGSRLEDQGRERKRSGGGPKEKKMSCGKFERNEQEEGFWQKLTL